MGTNRYGDNTLDRMKMAGGFSDRRGRTKLAVIVNKLQNQGLSDYEIQSALKNYGINVDTTTIRTILS
ncbi:MAG: hypothetical protein WD712_03255 [Candidatus Spechtbacterales bacterium]